MNILCLESKNNVVTKDQLFEATIFMMINSTNKWTVIAPINSDKAKFHKLVKYNSSKRDYISNLINNNAMPILGVTLRNKNKTNSLIEIIPFASEILLDSYDTLTIPNTINSNEVFSYIKQISNKISNDIKTFSNSKAK